MNNEAGGFTPLGSKNATVRLFCFMGWAFIVWTLLRETFFLVKAWLPQILDRGSLTAYTKFTKPYWPDFEHDEFSMNFSPGLSLSSSGRALPAFRNVMPENQQLSGQEQTENNKLRLKIAMATVLGTLNAGTGRPIIHPQAISSDDAN